MAVAYRQRLDSAFVARRWEIFHAAAPLLDRQGYRETSIGQIARACLLSPAGLYHYFPSKLELALFPFSPDNGVCEEWSRRLSTLPDDALIRLNSFLDFLAEQSGVLRLAHRLALEIGDDARLARRVVNLLAQAKADFLGVALAVAPHADPERFDDFFHGAVGVITGEIPGVNRERADVRRRLGDVARGWAVSSGVSPDAYDAAACVAAGAVT